MQITMLLHPGHHSITLIFDIPLLLVWRKKSSELKSQAARAISVMAGDESKIRICFFQIVGLEQHFATSEAFEVLGTPADFCPCQYSSGGTTAGPPIGNYFIRPTNSRSAINSNSSIEARIGSAAV